MILDRARLQAIVGRTSSSSVVHRFSDEQTSRFVLSRLGKIQLTGGPAGSLANAVQEAIELGIFCYLRAENK